MLDIQKYIGFPKIVVDKLDDTKVSYNLEYLPRGFGHTLWNALRRIMLGYDISASVTALKIRDVSHEYQAIEGIKENVVTILLNVKKLRFKLDEAQSEIIISQKFTWPKKITSDDIKLPAGVEILNQSEYLFEITDPSQELVIDFRVEKWYGYYSIDFLKAREAEKEDQEVDLLLIDNDFRVINSVVYDVEEVIDDVSGSTKDRLVITIDSKFPAYDPQEFMAFAGEILASYAKLFVLDDIYVDRSVLATYSDFEDDMGQGIDADQIETIKSTPIDALPLSERTRNALIKNGILYVEGLEKKTKGELLIMKWIGRKAIEEIITSLTNIDKQLAE